MIKAAYKALAMKYHPDTNPDSDRMQLINEAYDVLSSPTKKKSYDTKYRQHSKSRGYRGGKFDDYKSSASDDREKKQSHEERNKWNLIVEIYPNAERNLKDLQQISTELATRYRHLLINKKLAHEADQIAQYMEQKYLQKYFGSNLELQNLGKKLILSKDKKRALKINQLLKSLGEESSELIKEKIVSEIQEEEQRKAKHQETKQSRASWKDSIDKQKQEKSRQRSQLVEDICGIFGLLAILMLLVLLVHVVFHR